ncbi:MAG TPA: VWA domain-containing protein [Vicinamibacterales bacterium]
MPACRLAATTLLALAAVAVSAEQDGEQAPQPTFRTGVNLVRVDVSVTGRNDEIVTDLDAASFRVTEDRIPQKVETVQFVRLDGQEQAGRERDLIIRDRQHGIVEAEKQDVRLFALFLDDYHIDSHPATTQRVQRALESFVDALQPTDLVVLMDPLTTLDGLTFTRDKWLLRERIRKFKGRRGELVPVRSAVEDNQLTARNPFEVRATVTLTALEALVTHLGGLREGRKSVIFVSQGPPLGRRGSPVYPHLESVLQAANRGNVTVHVLDPRPFGSAPFGGAEALARLSDETGGRAIVNSNSPWDRLKQVLADASAYYLIGYSPSRELADGKFHRIDVRVTRPSVRVISRQGYWAPSAKEMESKEPADDRGLSAALALVESSDKGRPIDVWVGTAPAADGRTEMQFVWDVPARSRQSGAALLGVEPLTIDGGGALAAAQTIAAAGGDRSVARFLLAPGRTSVKMTVFGADGSLLDRWTDRLVVPDYGERAVALGTPRVYRTRTLLEARSFDAGGNVTPTVSRQFSRTDRLVIDVPWLARSGPLQLSIKLTSRNGDTLTELSPASIEAGRARVVLPLVNLAPGTYVMRFDATGEDVTQQVAFTVSQ